MQENKKTNTGMVIIIVVLVLAFAGYVLYNEFGKDINIGMENEEIEGQLTDDSVSSTENDDEVEDTDVKNNEEESDTKKEETTTSSTGKTSSKQSPLNIGEWGIASKYASGGYVDIPAKVTSVKRGESAAKEVENYLTSGNSIYKYEDAKIGMEWTVIEYDIDLTKMEKDSTAKLDTKVTGTGNNTSIKYNDVVYIVSTINMTPNNYTKGSIESCKFAVQLPIGCTDYLIALGASSYTQAFFKGE